MTDVFISYKREDRERCAALAEALRQLELSVWFDADIEPGTTFDREIERELKRARAVLVLWSERSVDSDWVRNEARVGRAADKLVAVKIEECDLPLEFMASQVVVLQDLGGNEDWGRVVGRLGRLVDRPGLLPFVEAQQAGRPQAWQDWLDRFGAQDPLAAKAQRYLAALGGPAAVDPAPPPPPPSPPPPAPVSQPAEPVAAAPASGLRKLPLLGAGATALAALVLAIWLWPDGSGSDEPAPATASPAASASAALPAASPASGSPVPIPASEGPAVVEAVPAPTATQDAPMQAAPATSCAADPYVIPISADSSAMMAAGEATLGAAARAYLDGCQGSPIRIRGLADRAGGAGDPMQLMRRRTAAVAAYLASQGLPRDRMETNVIDLARAPGGAQGERIVVSFGN